VSGLCGARHPDAEADPKNYGTPCDYPAGHPPVVDEEGVEWDHAYRFGGEPAMLWTGYLGEPKPPTPDRLAALCCGHLACQREVYRLVEEARTEGYDRGRVEARREAAAERATD
jgi:hypothetical protein